PELCVIAESVRIVPVDKLIGEDRQKRGDCRHCDGDRAHQIPPRVVLRFCGQFDRPFRRPRRSLFRHARRLLRGLYAPTRPATSPATPTSAMLSQPSTMDLDPKRTVAELKELRALTADENGAQRVAWTDTWLKARAWFNTKLAGLPVEVHDDAAG